MNAPDDMQLGLFADPFEVALDDWIERNPDAWRMWSRFAIEALHGGGGRIGAKAVSERYRWETATRKDIDEAWKWNNNLTAAAARRFMSEHPEYAGCFETRERKTP